MPSRRRGWSPVFGWEMRSGEWSQESTRGRKRTGSARFPPMISELFNPGPNEDAKAIEARVQLFSEDELFRRYHHLVDQRFERPLEYTERFELQRIEARLDYQDKDELERTAAMRETWEQERGEIVASIERLLAAFRGAR